MTLAASALRELATAPSHAAAASALRKIDHLQPSLTALVDAGALSPAATHAAVTTIGSMSQALRTYGSPAEAAHTSAARAFGRVLRRHGETTQATFLASADPRSVTSRLEKDLAHYASAPTTDNLALLSSALDDLDAHLAELPHEVTHTTY